MNGFVSWQRFSTHREGGWHLVGLSIATLALTLLLLFDVGAASSSTSAAANEPTPSILDDFERGLEDPLRQWGNWASSSIDGNGATMESFGGSAGHNEGDVHGDSYRVADIPAGDAEVYGTIAVSPSDQRWMYLYLNLQDVGTTGVDGYELRWFHWIAGDGLYLRKLVDGVSTNLVPPVQMSNTDEPSAGDTLLLRRVGGSLQVWHKKAGTWILRLSASDSAFQGGRIGFGSDESKARWTDFGGTGSTTPEPPPPALPATGILDSFERANEDPLSQGGAWSQSSVNGAGETLEVLSLAAGQNEGEVVQANSFRQSEVTGDAEVHARIATMPENDQVSYLYLNLQQAGTAGFDGYRMRWYHWIATDQLSIEKIVDGTPTSLVGPIGLDPGTGDTLLLRREGEGIELWRKSGGAWTKLLTSADPSFNSGKLGLGLDDDQGRWDDFGGGAVTGPPPPPQPSSGPPPAQSTGVCTGSGVHAHSTSRCLSDPVNTLTGAFITQIEDLATPGTGVPFAWSRSYTSPDQRVGRLGPGWTDNYSTSLAEHPTGDVTLHGDEGQQVEYTRRADGSFVGAPGSLSTLAQVAGGYELVRADQVLYRFDAQGRLTSIEDRNGEGVTLGYDGEGRLTRITDAATRDVTVSYNASGFVSEVETPDGRRVAYGYTSGRLTAVTDARGKAWRYTYDSEGRLATIVDPLQHTQVTNAYGSDGRIRSQTDAVGKTTSFAWDPEAEVASVTDPNGNVWKHDYDGGVLSKQIDPLNRVTAFAHDADLNTSAVTSAADETTTLAHDEAGNMLSATAPASLGSAQKTFTYNGRNDPVRITDAVGTVTSYTYDASGNTTGVTQGGTRVATYTYDAAGHVVTSADGNGKTTRYAYDAGGNLTSVTDPLGNETTYTYSPAGRVLSRVDPRGNLPGATAADFTWTWTYDAAGRVLTERDPLGHTTTHAYDDSGNQLTVTDAKGRTTSYEYDDANRLLSETGPDPDEGGPLDAPVTTYGYDDVGNKLSATDPLGRTTRFAYDSANRLVSTTGPDPDAGGPLVAPTTVRAYDADGNLANIVDPRGNVQGGNPDDFRTLHDYDAAGRLLTTADPLGHVTANTYDPVGNLVSVRDANNHTTAFTYDAAGRVVTVTAPDGGTTTYAYDDAGNRLSRRDDANHVTTYLYDDAGRLISEAGPDPDGAGPKSPALTRHTYDANGNLSTTVDPNGNATTTPDDGKTTFDYDQASRLLSIDYSDSTPDVTFAYDPVGNRVRMTDGGGIETRAYDGLDRLVSVTRGAIGFSFGYDLVGNVSRRLYPGGRVTEYDHDDLDRLVTARSNGQAVGYGYDVASNLVQTTLPAENGYVEARLYDRAGRLTEISSRKGAGTLLRIAATLDPVGNPTQVVRTGALGQTQTYTYDTSDRIVSVCFQSGACPGASDPFIRWTYDRLGNRLTEQRPAGTTSYSYDQADRLLAAGPTPYAYDQNGNAVSAGRRTFTYDLANRMKTTKSSSVTTTYSYDGDGVRLQASTGSKASQRTSFLWDISHALPQIAVEQNGSGSILRSYAYGRRRISMSSGSTTSYYHHDLLGSVANLTSSSGSTRWTYAYEPFGAVLTEQKSGGNPPPNPMRFAGEYLDPTELYHLRARQYDPTIGRFLSPDPVEQGHGKPSIAPYVYVGSRPTVLIDPSGETFQRTSDWSDAVGPAISPDDTQSPLPPIPGGLGAGCAARQGYPLGAIGGFNGGPAAHRAKPPHNWQSDNAIDLNAPVGTRVCAIFKGRISPTLGFGRSGEGYRLHLVGATDTAFYQHLSRIVVRSKQPIERGQLLGFSGCGSERVPHLHLALLRGDPMRYAPPYRKPVNYGGC